MQVPLKSILGVAATLAFACSGNTTLGTEPQSVTTTTGAAPPGPRPATSPVQPGCAAAEPAGTPNDLGTCALSCNDYSAQIPTGSECLSDRASCVLRCNDMFKAR